MKRDIALILIGAWLLGTLFMGVVAAENFYLLDRLLAARPNTGFNRVVELLGADAAREFMRYVSSELNRWFFVVWGIAQVVLGGLLVWMVRGTGARRVRVGAGIMLGFALILAAGLTPPILSVGRMLDFVPRDPPPPELATFGLLHAAYSIAELGKLGLGLALAWWLARGSGHD
jgi:hypothetical protein